MVTIRVRVSEKELELFEKYARIHGCSLSEVIRNIMLERIEMKYDLSVFDEYEQEKARGDVKTYSHEEAWEEMSGEG